MSVIFLQILRAYIYNGTVYIGKLMVHPEKQHQGVGTKLLIEIESKYPQYRYELFTSIIEAKKYSTL